MSKPSVAIIIIHFRDSKDTLVCLDSLAKVDSSYPFTPYVIFAQSHDDAAISNHSTCPKIISTDKNLGFSGNNNELIRLAIQDGFTHFILLNNDTIVDPLFIDPLMDSIKDDKVAFVCPKIYFAPNLEYHRDSYLESERGRVIWYNGGVIDWRNMYAFHWQVDEVDNLPGDDKIHETDFATGCCIGFTKSTLDRIGYLEDSYFLYYEDADWSIRAKRNGLRVIVNPASKIWHINSGSTGGSGSSIHVKYQTRNRFIVGMKYAPIRTKIALIRERFFRHHSEKK